MVEENYNMKKIIFGIGCGVDFKQYKKIEDIANELRNKEFDNESNDEN